MIEAETSSRAVVLAASLLIAMYLIKDAWMVAARPAGTWSRHRWLRLIGREEYMGRHRV